MAHRSADPPTPTGTRTSPTTTGVASTAVWNSHQPHGPHGDGLTFWCEFGRVAVCEKPQPSRCGTGWTLFGQCCYRLLTAYETFDDHHSDCENLDGQLVSIASLAENSLAQQLQYSSCSGSSCAAFIGLHRDSAGKFSSWLDGTPFGGSVYANWNTNEPNNSGGVEGCAEIIQSTGKWNDVQCSNTRLAVCEASCQTS